MVVYFAYRPISQSDSYNSFAPLLRSSKARLSCHTVSFVDIDPFLCSPFRLFGTRSVESAGKSTRKRLLNNRKEKNIRSKSESMSTWEQKRSEKRSEITTQN
jgi:hypothetical protein